MAASSSSQQQQQEAREEQPSVHVRELESLDIKFPDIQLDPVHCSYDVTLEQNQVTLLNKPRQLLGWPHPNVVHFRGTCATTVVEEPAYWQVKLCSQLNPNFHEGRTLCEMGLASWDALQERREVVGCSIDRAFRVSVTRWKGRTWSLVMGSNELVTVADVDSGPLDETFGFFQHRNGKVFVFLVRTGRLLHHTPVGRFSDPLYPMLNFVYASDWVGADTTATVESGRQLVMTDAMVTSLKELLGPHPRRRMRQ